MAPGSCQPGALTDPYVDALDHTVPQVMGSLFDVGVDDSWLRKRIALEQPVEFGPRQFPLAITAVKPLAPSSGNCQEKSAQCSRIVRDSVIRIVSAYFLA